ncbi:hypothetical protein E2C01_063785 [Portunus trituberculatus]|uniref:Uncharacterized protein n=1 Tax=Portunus trituberculatus TaxID=210409 RepID=A0A5B7HJZ4_PORTR|nr:hypothetical protein [Portunus trituberculatus]
MPQGAAPRLDVASRRSTLRLHKCGNLTDRSRKNTDLWLEVFLLMNESAVAWRSSASKLA